MKRSRFSDEQIIGILCRSIRWGFRQRDCRRDQRRDLYTWRKKYGGLEVLEARWLKALEEENLGLKKLLVESMMDVSTLREMLGKKLFDAWVEEERRGLGD